MKVTGEYFNSLDIHERAEIVFNDAKYIGLRTYYNQRLNLYSKDELFIEVWYLPNENKINKIELLENLKILDLYINQNI